MPSCRDFFVACAMPAQPTGKGQDRQALFSYQPSGRAAHDFNAARASASRHFAEGLQYTYYNRPLIKDVEYILPASPNFPILPSNSLCFEYDENGNRKKMSEKTELTSTTPPWSETLYNYDELSRLTSESRVFNGIGTLGVPGTFTLAYSYNLANQPVRVDFTSSSRPQDDFFFSHNYDVTGSITGVVGSPLAGNSTYLSGIKYSAWGASRRISFSHGGMEAYTYDEKMLIKDYRLTAPHETSGIQERMRAKYGYYPDGKIKTVENTEDYRFDRGYTYDDLGRVKNAFTDNMATAFRLYGTPPTPPGPFDVHPYNHTFQYNTWGQITNRAGKVWSIPDNRTQTYTAEGRRTGLSYDKTGNLINDGVNIYDYDAAGKSVGMRATFSTDTSRSWYDGDGLLVCSSPFASKKEVWIRSSVLNGAVIATIQAGNPGTTSYHSHAPTGAVIEQNIFIGNHLIAEQKYAYYTVGGFNRTSAFSWRHLKPLIGTESKVISSTAAPAYAYAKVAERNTDGVNMGLSDPTQPPTVSPDYEIPSVSGNNPNGPPLVLIDGQPVELHLAQQYLRIGAGEVDWKNTGILAAIQLGVFGHWESDEGSRDKSPANWKEVPDPYNPGQTTFQTTTARIKYRFVTDSIRSSNNFNNSQAGGGGQSNFEQLSPCLRDALREFFPSQTVQGTSYSPIDDARFRSGLPALARFGGELPGTVKPVAMTLGLYDIHYDSKEVDIRGGSKFSLETILEEVSHTEQFLSAWKALGAQKSITNLPLHQAPVSYGSAKLQWAGLYAVAGILGGGYDNVFEKQAKDKVDAIIGTLQARDSATKTYNICGFDLYK
jgi:hypothetical protein